VGELENGRMVEWESGRMVEWESGREKIIYKKQ
jgi:hypothetical protein